MNHGVLASTLTAAATAMLLAAPAFAQTQAAAVKTTPAASSAIPRTADGHPDLSGVFTNVTTVPMARPANCGTKEFYTAEDIAAGMGGARGCAQPGAQAAGRGAAGGGRGPAAANIDPETGQPALAVHYDTGQFGLSGNTIVKSSSMRTSIITGPEGKLPPVTPEAQKRQADRRAAQAHQWDGPETRPLGERCIMWPGEGPPMMSEGYNSNVQIVQSAGSVGILQEMIHDTRLIATNAAPALLPEGVHQWLGSSRGHWEGDKLVVETTNFTEKTSVQNTPTSDKLKVIEKFSRIDANNLLYEFTVDDPGTWTKPWSGEVTWTKVDSPIYEYACHEGNYGMANNLSGARATEKKAADQK
jgi:hypothetical protein